MARPTLLLIFYFSLLCVSVYVLTVSTVVMVQAYPHFLLKPESCVDKRLEVEEGERNRGEEREQSRTEQAL